MCVEDVARCLSVLYFRKTTEWLSEMYSPIQLAKRPAVPRTKRDTRVLSELTPLSPQRGMLSLPGAPAAASLIDNRPYAALPSWHTGQPVGTAPIAKITNGQADSTGPVQRKLIFTKSAGEDGNPTEIYSNSNAWDFLLKYNAICEKQYEKRISKYIIDRATELILSTDDHKYLDFDDLLNFITSEERFVVFAQKQTEPKEEKKGEDQKRKLKVIDLKQSVGGGLNIESGQELTLETSAKQSSRALYETEVGGKRCMLKAEISDSRGFAGMAEMEKNGIKVPASILVKMGDGKEYILMEYCKDLGEGLATINIFPTPEIIRKASYQLAIVHLTDISVGNADRLPWKANKNTGHLNNVFLDLLSGAVLGLDTEMADLEDEKIHADIDKELEKIDKSPKEYATIMTSHLLEVKDRNKLPLDGEKLTAFREGFEAGLIEGRQKIRRPTK